MAVYCELSYQAKAILCVVCGAARNGQALNESRAQLGHFLEHKSEILHAGEMNKDLAAKLSENEMINVLQSIWVPRIV